MQDRVHTDAVTHCGFVRYLACPGQCACARQKPGAAWPAFSHSRSSLFGRWRSAHGFHVTPRPFSLTSPASLNRGPAGLWFFTSTRSRWTASLVPACYYGLLMSVPRLLPRRDASSWRGAAGWPPPLPPGHKASSNSGLCLSAGATPSTLYMRANRGLAAGEENTEVNDKENGAF